jgi:hypothetical protein
MAGSSPAMTAEAGQSTGIAISAENYLDKAGIRANIVLIIRIEDDCPPGGEKTLRLFEHPVHNLLRELP